MRLANAIKPIPGSRPLQHSDFVERRSANYYCICDSSSNPQLEQKLENPDDFFARGNYKKIFKHDRTTSVALIADDGPQAFVVKRYNTRNWQHVIKRSLRKTRAYNCWDMSFVLTQIDGLHTPARIAYIEERRGPFKGRSYFISQYIGGQTVLDSLPSLSHSDQRPIINKIGELFLTLAANRISHGDMKASNLILVDDNIYLVDLDASRQYSSSFLFKRAYQRDRNRFLKNWSHDLRSCFSKLIPEHPGAKLPGRLA